MLSADPKKQKTKPLDPGRTKCPRKGDPSDAIEKVVGDQTRLEQRVIGPKSSVRIPVADKSFLSSSIICSTTAPLL